MKLRNEKGEFLKSNDRGDDYRLMQSFGQMIFHEISHMDSDRLTQLMAQLEELNTTNCGYIMYHFKDFILWSIESELNEREHKVI